MRRDNWQVHLLEAIESARHVQFEWGKHDCVIFAASCVEAVTEQNPLTDIAPWTSKMTALRRIKEVGGLEAWLDARYQRIEWHQAQRGDLGIMDQQDGLVLVVNAGHVWVGPSEEGLTTSKPNDVRIAWRIE